MAQTKLPITLAAIDIGNSAIKVGYFSSTDFVKKDVYPDPGQKPPRLLPSNKILVSSVVPRLNPAFKEAYPSAQWLQHDAVPVRDVPSGMGIDRIIALYAANQLYGKKVMVVDMGTALTITCGINNVFKGGIICPGRTLQRRALAKGTNQLPLITSLSIPNTLLQSETHPAIESGIHHLLILGIEQIIAKAITELGTPMMVVATGGDSLALAQHIPAIKIINPNLILQGIQRLS